MKMEKPQPGLLGLGSVFCDELYGIASIARLLASLHLSALSFSP